MEVAGLLYDSWVYDVKEYQIEAPKKRKLIRS
jgi:hypothetical protein